jgi:hypothetical protein
MSFFTGFILGVAGLLLLLVLVGILLGPRAEARAQDPPPDGQGRVRQRRRVPRRRPVAARPGRAMNAAQAKHVAELSAEAESARSPEPPAPI